MILINYEVFRTLSNFSPIHPKNFNLNISFFLSVPLSNATKCHCKKFEVTSSGRSKNWQKSKFGKYDRMFSSVASKDLFYNFRQQQYLFWVDDKPGYWMVR